MIRAVVFDLGNVVCEFDPDRRLEALADCSGLDRRRLHEAIWASGLDRRAEAGELSTVDAERLLLDALDNRVDGATLRRAWSTAFAADREVCDVVTSIDLPVFAFTNNGPMFTSCLEHELRPVASLFVKVICSWEIKARKPAPLAFERLCGELEREPSELLFVDDSRENTDAARSVGLAAVTFTSAPRLVDDLVRLAVRGRGSVAAEMP